MKKLCMILPLALILYFMVGCQNKEAMAELEAMKAQAAVEEQNKALIRKFFEEWNNRNIDILNELYVPNAKFHHRILNLSEAGISFLQNEKFFAFIA